MSVLLGVSIVIVGLLVGFIVYAVLASIVEK